MSRPVSPHRYSGMSRPVCTRFAAEYPGDVLTIFISLSRAVTMTHYYETKTMIGNTPMDSGDQNKMREFLSCGTRDMAETRCGAVLTSTNVLRGDSGWTRTSFRFTVHGSLLNNDKEVMAVMKAKGVTIAALVSGLQSQPNMKDRLIAYYAGELAQ